MGGPEPWLMARSKAHVEFLLSVTELPFCSTPLCKRCTSYGNSVCLSVHLSVYLPVTRQYRVKTTARSTVQFTLSDSKMCLVS